MLCTTGSPRKTTTTKGKKAPAFVLGDVDANVRAFLDRMRHQVREKSRIFVLGSFAEIFSFTLKLIIFEL